MLNVLTNLTDCGLTKDAVLLANIVSLVVTAIKIFIPVVLIIYGMIDLGKAVMSNDEKTMKEAQSRLIKRVLYAVLVFLVVTIVQVVFNFVGQADDENTTGTKNSTACITCFVNGAESNGTCK